MANKYKAGDKVKVKEYADIQREFGVGNYKFPEIRDGINFIDCMKKFCGRTVTIKGLNSGGYGYFITEGGCTWLDEMFKCEVQKPSEGPRVSSMKRDYSIKRKAGDTVTIRQWDDMVKEFGMIDGDHINVPFQFSPNMREHCGKSFEIESINGKRYHLKDVDWYWVEQMFEPAFGEYYTPSKDFDTLLAIDLTTKKSTESKIMSDILPVEKVTFLYEKRPSVLSTEELMGCIKRANSEKAELETLKVTSDWVKERKKMCADAIKLAVEELDSRKAK